MAKRPRLKTQLLPRGAGQEFGKILPRPLTGEGDRVGAAGVVEGAQGGASAVRR
jgi:hypothetical protein